MKRLVLTFGEQLRPQIYQHQIQPARKSPGHRHPKAAYYPANHTERQILHGERTEKFLPTVGFRFPPTEADTTAVKQTVQIS